MTRRRASFDAGGSPITAFLAANARYAAITAFLAANAADHVIFFGPVTRASSDKTAMPLWNFITATSDGNEARLDRFCASTKEKAEAMHAGVKAAVIKHPPCALIDLDDELELIKAAERRWPCAKLTKFRMAIEAERAA
jgi:hypothetical protein